MTRQETLGAGALAILVAGIALVAGAPRHGAEPLFRPVSVSLPDDDPAALADDLLTARCTACHSAAMIANQPPLSPDQWAAVVKKMREVYKAPVADAEVPAIVDHLAAISTAQAPET